MFTRNAGKSDEHPSQSPLDKGDFYWTNDLDY